MATFIGQDVGRYHIIEQLGEGGMATVYKAFDTRLERQVAIKFIRRDAFIPQHLTDILKRFDREVKALARHSHSNIVKIYDYGEYESAPYLVMEYLHGGSLKSRTGRPMPWREAVQLVLPIARALDYAHKRGILHRDVKPANILLNEAGESQLSDFGIAKILALEGSTSLTSMGVGVGTPEYMAPEQWTGKVVPQTDQYALGVVLYELITGCKPYTADTPAAILLKQANEPLPRPKKFISELPDAVEQVIFKVLAKDPQERYEFMGAFTMALENLLAIAQTAPKHILDKSETFDDIGIVTALSGLTTQEESISPQPSPSWPDTGTPIIEEKFITSPLPKTIEKTGISGIRRWLLIVGLGVGGLILIWGMILVSTVLMEQGRQGKGVLAMLATGTFTKPPTLIPTPMPMNTSRPVSASCPKLLLPKNESSINITKGPSIGEYFKFVWENYNGAGLYLLEIDPPFGNRLSIKTYNNQTIINPLSLSENGTYRWWIVVLDTTGNFICTSNIYTFTKIEPSATASKRPRPTTTPLCEYVPVYKNGELKDWSLRCTPGWP